MAEPVAKKMWMFSSLIGLIVPDATGFHGKPALKNMSHITFICQNVSVYQKLLRDILYLKVLKSTTILSSG